MGYIDRSLISGERLVYRTRLHWNVLIKPMIWGGVPLAAGGAILATRYAAAAWVLIPLGVLLLIFAFINYGITVISGTGGSKEKLPQTKGPFEFRRQVQEQIAAILEPSRG